MQNFTPPRAPAVLVKAKESYSLWFKILADFPKTYRHNLGGKIEGYFLEFLENIPPCPRISMRLEECLADGRRGLKQKLPRDNPEEKH